MRKLDKLFNLIVKNTFISLGESGQLVLPFLNMSDSTLEFLNRSWQILYCSLFMSL